MEINNLTPQQISHNNPILEDLEKKQSRRILQLIQNPFIILGGIFVIVLLSITGYTLNLQMTTKTGQFSSTVPQLSPTEEVAIQTITPTLPVTAITRTPTKQELPTKPTSTTAPSQTSVSRDTTPPTFTTVGGPQDGATVTFSNFCFPITVSDNVSKYPNIWVRVKFDSANFSDWSTDVSQCYNNVHDGSHTFSVQAKDEAGNISSTITRSFTIQVPVTNVKLEGFIFEDTNCNTKQDHGEPSLSTPTTVNILDLTNGGSKTVSSDRNGYYSYTTTVKGDQTLKLQASVVSPSGYKSNPNYSNPQHTFSSNFVNDFDNVPQIPNSLVSSCGF